MLPDRDLAFLADIQIQGAIGELEEFTAGISLLTFSDVRQTRLACICLLQIIGEATKRLSPELRAEHVDIPWRKMAGLRDKLIHGYDKVDDEAIWGVIKPELPRVRVKISAILASREPK